MIREKKPDLVLLDVHLRKINGLELLRVIRATPDLKNTRILMSSGMDFRHECLQAGADDFMIKPYMPDDLIKKIRQTLQIPK